MSDSDPITVGRTLRGRFNPDLILEVDHWPGHDIWDVYVVMPEGRQHLMLMSEREYERYLRPLDGASGP